MIYLNIKTKEGVETIDMIDRNDFDTRKEYVKAKRKLIRDHIQTGMQVYESNRADAHWRKEMLK